jgi:hypothetical protein
METLVMKKTILAGMALLSSIAVGAPTYAKALVYKYNDTVSIYITSLPCGIDKYKEQFPYAAKAIKTINGKKDGLLGCFTGKDNVVIIQWQDINGKPSDQTVLPTDEFQTVEETI